MYLSTLDKGRVAYEILRAIPRDYGRSIAFDALDGAGYPVPFLSVAEDAKWWAGCATLDELRAYGAHAFLAMPRRVRSDFLAWGAKQ